MSAVGGVLAGRFEIQGRLGAGGIATVVAAHDLQLDAEVALKILHPHLAEQPVIRERFAREVALCRKLDHPAIVRTWELYESDARVFFSMERCDGPNLREWVRGNGTPTEPERLGVIRQLLSALAAAHAQGVIHRDIKPHNVIRLSDGRIKVLDFGLARVESMAGLTASSVVLGTPEYLAPESLGGLPIDARADLYSLGILWYELAEGTPPFSGNTFEIMHRMGSEDGPAPPSVPPREAGIVERLLRRDPAERFTSAQEVLAALDATRTDEQEHQDAPQAICPHCGHLQEQALDVCLGCGAPAAAAAGDALLILTRAGPQAEAALTAILGRFGATQSASVETSRALRRRPVALLNEIDARLAESLRRQVLETGSTAEVRRRSEDLLSLLHGDGVPGAVFVAGLLGGWAALCLLGGSVAGPTGLIIALAAGPSLAWWLSRHPHLFVSPVFELPTRAVQSSGLAPGFAAFLDAVSSSALRRLGTQLVQRAWRLDRSLDGGQLDAGSTKRLRRLCRDSARDGLDALAALQPVEDWLAAADPRRLYEELEAARAASADLSGATQALLRIEELRHERESRLQRVLHLSSSLEAARADIVLGALQPDALSLAEGALSRELAAVSQARDELAALLGEPS